MSQTDNCAVRETHISVLVFLGDRVLKLRKPLSLDFADFSTPSARATDCRREVELNRRLAPDVYLGVADITMDGETFEHCVVMRRLPAERSLACIVTSEPESVWRAELEAVATSLAEFHARADRSAEISKAAAIDALTRQFEANAAAMERFVGTVLERDDMDQVGQEVHRFLAGRGSLFSARMAAGQICDGHGDLQAGDIYCLEDGPRILDCLEFDDELRYGDVAADVAFLAMDLERLGAARAAETFIGYYEQRAGMPFPHSLLHLYIALRACVRSKVACLRHVQGDDVAATEATELLDLALAHLRRARVRLVLVGGLPGSGKSTLATALGEALGATVLRSDELRSTFASSDDDSLPEGTFGRGRYAPERKQWVYDTLIGAARTCLGFGQSVVLDASWIDSSHRKGARSLATECTAALTEIRCTAPTVVAEKRITARRRDATDPSEASVEVARAMAQVQSPWPSACAVDTDRAPELVLADALEILGVG